MITHRVCQTSTQIARNVDRPETERLAWFRRWRFCTDLFDGVSDARIRNNCATTATPGFTQLHDRNGDLVLKVQVLEQELKEAQPDRPESKSSALAVAEFPEPADLLNQLKARRKKSRADLADIEVLLGYLVS
jgi:hypothetical protein